MEKKQGGVIASSSNIQINESIFNEFSGMNGGAISVSEKSLLFIQGGNFLKNMGVFGSAIFVEIGNFCHSN